MKRFASCAAVFAALSLTSICGVAVAAESSGASVDYFADNGFGNSVGPVGAVHHEGTTYVAYQGPLEDSWVASYNHHTQEWAGPFLAGVSLMGKDPTRNKIDNHGKPAMVIDDQGYIHLAYGGHGGTKQTGKNPLGNHHYGEQRHVVSSRPLDITRWELLENVSPFGTYSSFLKMDNGDIYLFYRHGAHRSNWVYQLSTDHGRTFADPVSIVKTKRHASVPGMDAWYMNFVKAPGDKIAARLYYHLCKDGKEHDGDRRHGYFLEMDTRDHVWRNIAGKALKTPMTKEYADEHARFVDTGDDLVHAGPLSLDAEGHPHMLLFRTDDKGPLHGGPKTIFHYRWDGERWLEHPQPQLPKLKGNLSTDSAEEVTILLAGRNEEKVGEVAEWNSVDGGETFEKGRVYFSAKGAGVMISDPIENAHPDARFVMAVGRPRSDYRFLSLVGDHGVIQRDQAEADVLTEAQKTAPLFGKTN